MIAAIAFLVAAAPAAQITCPVMQGGDVKTTNPAMEYRGLGFIVCCPGCDKSFAKDPSQFLSKGEKSKLPIGFALFDAVSGKPLSALKAKHTLSSKGILYGFGSEANLKSFKANPGRYAVPAKESLTDAVSGKAIAKYSKAAGYVDYQGVRFYAESAANLTKMKANPAKMLKAKLQAGKAPAVIPAN